MEIKIRKTKKSTTKNTSLTELLVTLTFLATLILCPISLYKSQKTIDVPVEQLTNTADILVKKQSQQRVSHKQQRLDIIANLSKKSEIQSESFEESVENIVATSTDRIQDIIKKSKSKPQITCIARNIINEAGNQSYSGRVAVAMVTVNRAKLSKMPPCAVVYAHNERGCQFTWTCSKIKPIWESDAWKQSLVIAYLSYNNLVDDITSGATYYFNPKIVNPKWANEKIPVSNQYIVDGYLGDHRFFKAGVSDVYAQN